MVQKIGTIRVNLLYWKTGADTYTLDRRCGECECSADLLKYPTPTVELAGRDILCFDDATCQGIVGKGCVGKMLQDGPNLWEFEIQANIQKVTV